MYFFSFVVRFYFAVTIMWWVIVLVIIAMIAVGLESVPGKIIAGATVVAIGFLLLRWITGIGLLVTLAKVCAVVIVVTIVGSILIALIGR